MLISPAQFNSTTWRSKKRTTAALRTLFSQLHAFLTALRSCASLVSNFRHCHAVCIVPAGITQEEGHTEFLHLPSAVFLAKKNQPFPSRVDREKSNFVYERIINRSPLLDGHFRVFFFVQVRVTAPRFELTSQRQKVSRLPINSEPPERPATTCYICDSRRRNEVLNS